MKKTIIIAVIVIVVGAGIYYFISNNNSGGNPNPLPPGGTPPLVTDNPATTTTPVAEEVVIDIKNFAFNPVSKTVKVGAKVTWVNNDTVAHTITSDKENLLNSETLSPGQSFSFTFVDPGSVNYNCKIHPTMKGSISVVNRTTF